MSLSVLDRELYDENLAAQVLRMPPSTLHWWLEGGWRKGRKYEPVIRPEPTGNKAVTWGELVEAQYLLGYRRDLGVKLSGLRWLIEHTRSTEGIPYRLAHARPWVGKGRRLLLDAQRTGQLPADLWAAWEPESGQLLLTAPAESFLARIEFEDGHATRIRPAGADSPVVIDPDVRFGTPAVRGIPTEALADQVRAGDPIEMVAEDFGLALDDLIAALDYEQAPSVQAA
jgi:uncharacterized protein (DUF433 family)